MAMSDLFNVFRKQTSEQKPGQDYPSPRSMSHPTDLNEPLDKASLINSLYQPLKTLRQAFEILGDAESAAEMDKALKKLPPEDQNKEVLFDELRKQGKAQLDIRRP